MNPPTPTEEIEDEAAAVAAAVSTLGRAETARQHVGPDIPLADVCMAGKAAVMLAVAAAGPEEAEVWECQEKSRDEVTTGTANTEAA